MTEMAENRFRIVFSKLAAATKEQASTPAELSPAEATPHEVDEIDELRRLALELAESEQAFYTTT